MAINLSERYTKDDLIAQEKEWRKIKKDFPYFVNEYGYMWLKEGGDAVQFKLWEVQWEAAREMQDEQKLIFLKTRQLGLSWLASAYTLWLCMTTNNFHAYYTSIGLKEVQEQMARIRFIFANLPDWMQERAFLGGKDCKDNDSIIEFTNGSAIHATASGKSSGHGSAPGIYILDEWARVENALEKWRAIGPSLGKRSKVFIISTSDGINNHYAELWAKASSGESAFKPIFYSCKRHPDYTDEYLARQKEDFVGDEQGFLQAFPETPEDAFLSSSRAIFPADRISEWKEYIHQQKIEPLVGWVEPENDVDGVEKAANGFGFVQDRAGYYQLWREPLPNHHYTIGSDVSYGLVSGDWSVSIVYDTITSEVVAMYRAKISPEMYGYEILKLAKYYNNAWVCVEVNVASEIIISDLKATYPWLYMRQQRERITDLPTLIPGFYMTSTSKPRVIYELRRKFMDKSEPLRIYSLTVLNEMGTYEQDGKSMEAMQGMFDDCVIALALAYEAVNTMPFTTMDYSVRSQHANRGALSWRAF